MLIVWTMQITPEIHVDPNDPPRAIEGLSVTLMLALALVLAVTVPGLGMSAMFVVFLAGPIEIYRHRRITRRAGRPPR